MTSQLTELLTCESWGSFVSSYCPEKSPRNVQNIGVWGRKEQVNKYTRASFRCSNLGEKVWPSTAPLWWDRASQGGRGRTNRTQHVKCVLLKGLINSRSMVLMTVDIQQDLNHLWPPPHVRLIRTVSIFHGRGERINGTYRRV